MHIPQKFQIKKSSNLAIATAILTTMETPLARQTPPLSLSRAHELFYYADMASMGVPGTSFTNAMPKPR
jgi:hypothetical protein